MVKSLSDSSITIVGLGLMGGSLALALRARKACKNIFGVTRNPVAHHAVDRASADLSLVSEADIIVLAAPVRTILEQLPRVSQIAQPGAMVIDLGSTKCEIVGAMEELPSHLEPIGGHPMCGKEISGFQAADAELYQDAVFVLSPLERTSSQTLSLARALAEAIGARPIIVDPKRHDKIVANISHLPYTLASALMSMMDQLSHEDNLLYTLAASGFRDTSRLAASDTTMMLDILMTNRQNVADAMCQYSRRLAELADMIYEGDESDVRGILEVAATRRKELFKP